jgi:choline-sulfatase
MIDREIGRLLDCVNEERSVVIVTADHGDLFGEHGHYGHPLQLYEGLVRVPLMIKVPASVGVQPKRIDAPVCSMDIVPTVLELVGLSPEEWLDGVSLLPQMRSVEEEQEPRGIISEVSRKHLAVRRWPWKLIVNVGRNERRLYNLEADKEETENVAEAFGDLCSELEGIALEHIERHKTGADEMPRPQTDERIKAQLRSLGYFE